MPLVVSNRRRQTPPEFPVALRDFVPDGLWIPAYGTNLNARKPASTFTGTPATTSNGLARGHDGTSQLELWTVPGVNAFPVVIAASFVVTETATATQTAAGLGDSATVTGGAYSGVGQYTATTVDSWMSTATGGSDARITGPAAVVGRTYNVIRISRSITDHTMFVNGERFTSSASTTAFSQTLSNWSVGACVRVTTPLFYGKQKVARAFYATRDPGDGWAREWSRDPLSLFEDSIEHVFVPAASGIVFDIAGNSGDQAATNTYSGSASWNGANRFLAIDVSMLGAGVTVSSMTYGGANCTFIGAKSTVTSFGRVEQWRIASSDSGAPATGSNTLVVNLSGSIEFTVEWASYTGVHQNSPIEAFNSAQATNAGSATDASVSITSVADNCWIHAAVVANDTSITAGNTSRNNISGTLGSGANEDNGVAKTPAGSVTMSYSGMGITTTWAIAGYAIRPIAASNLATTLSAVFGSFTLSGQTSVLKDNRLIPSGFGSFALNGQTANLLKSSKVLANFGSFALTGQVVSLRNNKLVPLAFGSFTLTGIAAAFNYIKQLTINAGNYALNGQTATLSKAVKLVIANGSFALNGQTATFSRTHSVLSAFGSFVLNGQAVGLLETHRLPIGMGAYALNGQTVALYTSKLFSVAYGGYTLAGQAASFLANRRLALTVGTYALNGQVATLIKVGLSTLAASSGGYVLNGQVADLLANRKLSLVNGSYAYTGQSVQLTLVPTLLATNGLYVLNGQNITFHQDRRLHANQGAYTLAGIDATLHLQAAYNRSVARTLLINPENRTFAVNPENRTHSI